MIKLLPDHVANQIAAGEVVQRPASAVKELMENAVDAGASQINLLIKDAGRTLIQVIDNGSGMNEFDARMCFERHATSKISTAHDLEHIQTFGFRGEALASIAAVSEVELKTRRAENELGTLISIHGSKIIAQESVQATVGSSFVIRNLFYNIPARRKFLKSDASELRHIISEFQRVSICNPDIEFVFYNNDAEVFRLPKGNLRLRIQSLFGKQMNPHLIEVGVDTPLIKITGLIGKPESARKRQNEQFLFVNNRYFRSPYFQKALQKAYDQLLPAETFPSFFLFFDIDPSRIDVNIHPSKTEIKFDEEQAIWQILHAIVRESLSKNAVSPSIDFDMDGAIDIPTFSRNAEIHAPEITIDRSYNPFNEPSRGRPSATGWEDLYRVDRDDQIEAFEQEPTVFTSQFDESTASGSLFPSHQSENRFLQVKGKYIITTVRSGIMLIDIYRAHQRILYEQYLVKFTNHTFASQQSLYPQALDFSPGDYMLIENFLSNLNAIGFDLRNFGLNTLVCYAIPVGFEYDDLKALLDDLLDDLKEHNKSFQDNLLEHIAQSMARSGALRCSQSMSELEMQHLVDSLFACVSPNLSPDGKPCLSLMSIEDIENKLRK